MLVCQLCSGSRDIRRGRRGRKEMPCLIFTFCFFFAAAATNKYRTTQLLFPCPSPVRERYPARVPPGRLKNFCSFFAAELVLGCRTVMLAPMPHGSRWKDCDYVVTRMNNF